MDNDPASDWDKDKVLDYQGHRLLENGACAGVMHMLNNSPRQGYVNPATRIKGLDGGRPRHLGHGLNNSVKGKGTYPGACKANDIKLPSRATLRA